MLKQFIEIRVRSDGNSVDRAQFPAIWQVRTLLPEVKDDDIFENLLGLVMTGLLQSAPHACDCHRPAGS